MTNIERPIAALLFAFLLMQSAILFHMYDFRRAEPALRTLMPVADAPLPRGDDLMTMQTVWNQPEMKPAPTRRARPPKLHFDNFFRDVRPSRSEPQYNQ